MEPVPLVYPEHYTRNKVVLLSNGLAFRSVLTQILSVHTTEVAVSLFGRWILLRLERSVQQLFCFSISFHSSVFPPDYSCTSVAVILKKTRKILNFLIFCF